MMSDQNKAFAAVQPQLSTLICYCQESPGTKGRRSCDADIAQAITDHAQSCPGGAIPEKTPVDPKVTANLIGVHASDGSQEGTIINILSDPPKRSSLLLPAQFRAIVFPGCRNVNRTYYDCASEAYTTSRGNYGSGGCSLGLPPQCSQGGDAWLQ
jgi:hypothetical protein